MKTLFILGLLALTFVAAEDLYFLSDEEMDTDGFDADQNTFANFTDGAGKILELAEKFISIFKSSSSSVIKERIEGKGFRYFAGGCTTQQVNGLFRDRIPNYLGRLLNRIKVAPEKRQLIIDNFEDLKDSDAGVAFNTYDLLFNSQSRSNDNCNSLSFIAGYNNRGTLDIFYSHMHSDFKLAPDITIMQNSKSYVGGLWSSTKDKIIEKPHDITYDQVKVVMAFFEYIGLEQFANFMGIKLPSITKE